MSSRDENLRSENESKKPTPRRLFSFDHLRSSSSREAGDSDHVDDGDFHELTPPMDHASEDTWFATKLEPMRPSSVTSTIPQDSPRTTNSQVVERPLNFPPPRRSNTPDSVQQSTSSSRWEHLRQHVLQASSRSSTPVEPSRPTSVTSSITSFTRPSTPKPSRLARLGFRQVVDVARERDDTRRFGEEIMKNIWLSRQAGSKTKAEKEPSSTTASPIYRPFMPNTTSGVSSLQNTGLSKKDELRRPQSIQSLSSGRFVASLKPLCQLLMYHAGAGSETVVLSAHLPHEGQVLAALLNPFLLPTTGNDVDEEERLLAIETFELLIKGWTPSDEAASVARCMWCCKAAMVPPSPNRSRVLGYLWRCIVPGDRNRAIISPIAMQSVAHGLLMLLASLHALTNPVQEEDVRLTKDLILQFISGTFGELNEKAVEEEYEARWLPGDMKGAVRKALFLEALTKCLENCAQVTRVWLLQHAIEEYWPVPSKGTSVTLLQGVIRFRTINTFCRAAHILLTSLTVKEEDKLVIAHHIVRAFQSRILPETDSLDQTLGLEAQTHVAKVALEILCLANAKEQVGWAITTICRWLKDRDGNWKGNFEKRIRKLVSSGNWASILRILLALVHHIPEEERRPLFTFILPLLNDRMVEDPPPFPYAELSSLLDVLSHMYPQLFYKPFFSCAASSQEFTIVNHLCTLAIHSKFIGDYWNRDAEMMCVALLSDAGAEKETMTSMVGNTPWGVARLGQLVLLLELIGKIQAVRRIKESSPGSDRALMGTTKFVATLESRLNILLDVKERSTFIAPSQRMLFCILFREIRLLNRSLKPAPWLHRTISWFVDFCTDYDLGGKLESEVNESTERIQGLYLAAQEGVRENYQRRSTMLLSAASKSPAPPPNKEGFDLASSFAQHKVLIDSLSKGFASRAMKLFVTMSSLLVDEDYRRLGPLIWEHGLVDHIDTSATASACFLLMQCAEKVPEDLLAVMEVDLQSSDDITRLRSARKVGTLINWRFQILSQNVIVDRAHRSFKLTRAPLPFLATDMGTSLYVQTEDFSESKDKDNIPGELRKRLAEIGWAEEDASVVDPRQQWIKTPMSILPIHRLERMDVLMGEQLPPTGGSTSVNVTPLPSPRKTPKEPLEEPNPLLRRNSSSGGPLHNQKRRAIFVPPLTSVFRRVASLVYDSNYAIASTARTIIWDLMRGDPALLTRPVLEQLSGDNKDVVAATSTLAAFLQMRRVLPPPLTHNLFNNLAGFLKHSAKQSESHEALYDFGLVMPILSMLTTQVSGMSFREIRRAKIEPLLIPSGSLWFPTSAPKGPMFPRYLEEIGNPFEDVPSQLVSITMIRTAQNLLFLSVLKRNQQDVQVVRKNLSRLVLPSKDSHLQDLPLEMRDFAPQSRDVSEAPKSNKTLDALSLVLSRSYLLLVAQVFRSMSRHLSDRNELAVLVDGLNRILLAHGDDIGIVGQSLIALMVASTRFKRLFTSGGGYTLFMPALVKIYSESGSHPGIRPAIEYAINRFYALHKESFLYQSLGIIGQMFMLPGLDENWFGKSVYDLFLSLKKGVTAATTDAAGIHNINKLQEREALLVSTADEKPQTFFASIRRTESQASGDRYSVNLPEEYETERLRMDNFVRLFLTVIAHDPSILRAQHYLRLLRYIVPYLYNASDSTRSTLQDGITALCVILTKGFNRAKTADGALERSAEDSAFLPPVGLEGQVLENSKAPSDIQAMRIDFLFLVLSLGQAGGDISLTLARQTLNLLKVVLKDCHANDPPEAISSFLSDFVRMLLIREQPQLAKAVVIFLQDLSPILHAYMVALDFTGVFEVILRISSIPVYVADPTFAQVVVSEICTAGLAACELAASENQLMTLPYRPTLVQLIGEAIFLQGADVIEELEKRTPSHAFLAGVILPLTLTIATSAQLLTKGLQTQDRHRTALANAWFRLLFYTMSACQRSRPQGELRRSKSKENRNSDSDKFWRSQLPSFMIALQILKVIIIRGEADISSVVPGIWERIAGFCRMVLADGNAEFALRGESAFNSPAASPRSSGQFDFSYFKLSVGTFSRPRVTDYALWSMLEFVCAYKSPLRLQLRLLATEKVSGIDAELQRLGNRNNPLSSPSSRRTSMSVFSKVRRSVSGMPSPGSPRLLASPSPTPHDPTLFLDARRPGYQITPVSPQNGPRIVHLGPASPSVLLDAPSPGGINGGGMRTAIKTTRIKSLSLTKVTYRRVRGVQSFMGYDVLIPLPPTVLEAQDDSDILRAWTKNDAIQAILQETKELMEEFEESFGETENDRVPNPDRDQPSTD